MEDRELLRMAAFKLQQTARRLKSLAREAHAPAARAQLEALAVELCEREATLWTFREAAPDGPSPEAAAPTRPSRGAAK